MNCAQSGCEVGPDSIIESGVVPRLCPTCGHPLRLVLTIEEVGELMGLPHEEPEDDPLLGGEDTAQAGHGSDVSEDDTPE